MGKKQIIAIWSLSVVIVVGFFVFWPPGGSTVTFGGVNIAVDVADDPQEKTQGLSGRPSLGENEGMLFIYEAPGLYSFWMKEMNFPIDIIWIDSDKQVVDITESLAPSTYPTGFAPSSPAQYILEVNAGYSLQKGIEIGDTAVFDL